MTFKGNKFAKQNAVILRWIVFNFFIKCSLIAYKCVPDVFKIYYALELETEIIYSNTLFFCLKDTHINILDSDPRKHFLFSWKKFEIALYANLQDTRIRSTSLPKLLPRLRQYFWNTVWFFISFKWEEWNDDG